MYIHYVKLAIIICGFNSAAYMMFFFFSHTDFMLSMQRKLGKTRVLLPLALPCPPFWIATLRFVDLLEKIITISITYNSKSFHLRRFILADL